MAEHKHAEVLRAIADGKAVQYSSDGESYLDANISCLRHVYDPITNQDLNWRIKPDPKPDYVRHIGFDYNGDTTNQRDGAPTFLTKQAWEYAINITFDGETDEPKSVELAK